VLYIYGAEGSVLDGFTVTGGMANGGGLDDNGGGVFCKGVPARMANCLFSANLAANEGGAVFVESGELVLTGCRLVGNAANGWGGGAVRLERSSFDISGCFFGGNTATAAEPLGYGGAVRAQSCVSGTIADCLFVANRGRQGGAIRTSRGTSPTIARCRFSGNQATGFGGAIANGGAGCSPVILGCTFAGNESPWGGAIANWTSGAKAIGCVLAGNVASSSGGAIATHDNVPAALSCSLVANAAPVGGAVYACRNSSMALVSCILWGNRASSAGSQCYYDDEAGASGGDFVSCLVQGGWNGVDVHLQGAAWAKDGGGNLDADPALAGMAACGAWTAIGNYSANSGMTVLTCAGAGWQQDAFAGCFLNPKTSQYLQYCVVGNAADTVTILGDCTSFTAVGDAFQVNDYRLRPASSCIDAGLGDADTPVNDLAGNARYDDPGMPNTGIGTPSYVDIGAYEFQGTQPAAIRPATVGAAAPLPASGQDWTVPDLGLELVWVGPGEFQMGAKDGEDHERPVHQVRISHGFWLGRYEVTQAEYQALAGQRADLGSGARLPVVEVSWYGAEAFCRKLTERERGAGRLPEGCEYRLPTEAEWEYAARGGTQSRGTVYAGSDRLDEVAWHMNNSRGAPHPVGGKEPNELGIHDLTGTVWEWCLDWSDPGFYSRSPAANPLNAEAATLRVTRGGSWVHVAEWARLSHRGGWRPERANDNIGFRVSLAPAIATPAQ
jgi:formylglycine-generating enzyme required for sulfatase activity